MDRKIVYGYIRQFLDHARRATGLDASSWMIVMMPKSRVGITCDLAQAVDPAVTRGTRIRFEIAPNIVPITFVPPSKPALMSTGDIACQRTDSSWFTCEFLARSIDFPSFFFFFVGKNYIVTLAEIGLNWLNTDRFFKRLCNSGSFKSLQLAVR